MRSAVWSTIVTLILTCLPASASEAEPAHAAGDNRKINFVRPFAKALETAKAENRLLFLKPIYGGMDEAGSRDYRRGSW